MAFAIIIYLRGYILMRVLISDRDERIARLVGAKVEALGNTVRYEADKNRLNDLLRQEKFDFVMIDPSPLSDVAGVVVNIRKAARDNGAYVMLLSDSMSDEQAVAAGANGVVAKPINPAALEETIVSAKRFVEIVEWVGDSSEDFPSAGGIIAKSAFNQLFLSAIDRAARYGEKSYVLFISMDNYAETLSMDGPYAANSAAAKIAQFLVKIRRQSDILAQVGKSEYVLLLQRPVYPHEPMDAANRFADSLSRIEGMEETGVKELKISVKLIDVPSGFQHVYHDFSLDY